ncbi:L,D-transpeptidase [Flavobacterium sp.]|uniref:L,D-transpeptidase n=1 Tax=Flavobacterium sp. TaxID=239 RepID=UPI002C1CC1C3|nr:L,D-transpeptidase [Flavobacterium sp.]HSD09136.1 L,D-transpeptidase [Flavobacterium sp.]
MEKLIIVFGIIALTLCSCKNENNKIQSEKNTTAKKNPARIKPKDVSYTLENAKEWLKNHKDVKDLSVVLAVNRTDKNNFAKLDSVVIPKDLSGDVVFYLPFPLEVTSLQAVDKIILFSYSTQTFGIYENGILMRSGPTNMGRKKDPTPTGLFFTNWKAEETTSTFNDEWNLKWNFNVENKKGVGFHQYELPGYPASHSCMRLQEDDAKFLYNWADQWVLENDENIKFYGTPVIVFGTYNFDAPKPWLQLVNDPKALNISEDEIKEIIAPYLNKIIHEQEKRKIGEQSKIEVAKTS